MLEKLKPGILTKEVVEGLSYFYFSGSEIVTYNDKISIQHPLKTDFQLFVKAQDLYKLISKLTVEEIALFEKDSKLHVQCKTLKANLSTIEDSEIKTRIDNVSDSLKKAKWKTLPDNFSDSISLCMFTASKQESEGTLTCVYVKGKDCISSDNTRVSHAILNSDVDNLFLKASEIKNLIAITPSKYAVTNSWIHFKNKDKCIFSIRNIVGDYPDYLQFFDFEGTEVKLPKEIIEGIDITSILSDPSDPSVKFKITKGFCTLSVNSEAGTITHRSKIDYKDKDINFTINPNFLKEMMSHSSSIIIGKDKAKLQTDNFSLLALFFS